jgi:hypothetical protein
MKIRSRIRSLGWSVLAVLLALLGGTLLAAAPASAGAIYVALVADEVIDGVPYETVLEVSNPSNAPRSFVTYFVPSFEDGTDRPEDAQPDVKTVPPGRTLLFTGLPGASPRGLLELDADPELVVSARLVPVGEDAGVGAQVPVISSRNLVEPGRRFHVQGLRRGPGVESLLSLINLAQTPTRCDVDLIGADGVARMDTTRLTLEPLSGNHWEDVLAIVGIESAAQVRAEVVCDGPAYGFGLVFDAERGSVTGLDLAQTADSQLAAPGDELPCPTGGACFEFPGIVHRPTAGDETRTVELELDEGAVYSAVRLQMTVELAQWNGPPGSIHNFFWLYRNEWSGNTFGYMQVRAPDRNKVAFHTNVDLPQGVVQTARIDKALPAGRTYRVDYVYDTAARRAQLLVFDESGGEVARLSSSTTTDRVRQQGDAFFVQLGLREQHSEVPSYGWTYRDLRVEFLP